MGLNLNFEAQQLSLFEYTRIVLFCATRGVIQHILKSAVVANVDLAVVVFSSIGAFQKIRDIGGGGSMKCHADFIYILKHYF
jgi:hypothetical protein